MKASAGVVYLIEPDGELHLQASRGAPAPAVAALAGVAARRPGAAGGGDRQRRAGVPGTRAEIAGRYP